jgi:predicted amidohydrolase
MEKNNQKPTIAIAQIRYFDTPEKHNVAKIKKFIEIAAKSKADIVCFPETCIHKTDYLKFDDKLITEIQESCRKNKIWAVVSDTFKIKNKNYKTALLIDRQGNIKGNYKKINIYDDNTAPGKDIFVHQTDFAKIGIVICWDLAFPGLFEKMKKAGVQIVFCPAKWCYEYKAYTKDHQRHEKNLLQSLILARTFENIYFLAYASPITDKNDLISYSAIAGPHTILKDIYKKEGLIVQQIDLGEIEKFSKLYPGKK